MRGWAQPGQMDEKTKKGGYRLELVEVGSGVGPVLGSETRWILNIEPGELLIVRKTDLLQLARVRRGGNTMCLYLLPFHPDSEEHL